MTKTVNFSAAWKKEDFRRISRARGVTRQLGKGGEWVMTTPAGEPMILPYDPPAGRDPQSFVFVSILKYISMQFVIYLPAGEPMILPYDPPAGWDPQSFVFVSILK